MDHMDVDTAAKDDRTTSNSSPHTAPSQPPRPQSLSHHPSNPVSIVPPTSRFKPAPVPPSNQQPMLHTTAFNPFASAPTANMYSHNMFKPLSPSSASNNPKPHVSFTRPSPPANNPPNLSHTANPPSDSLKNVVPVRRTPFKPTAPLQIPRTSAQKPATLSDPNISAARSLGSNPQPYRPPAFSPDLPIPQSLPNIQPSYPATLFGGLSADDEHVTVWEPLTGKTVAGNAAPYRRNLAHWLQCHPGWEEKSDELKSSKRRSAARRGRSAAEAFAALCHYPVAAFLAGDAAQRLSALGGGDHLTEKTMMNWGMDDFVRLQEAIFRLGQECHKQSLNRDKIDKNRWATVCAQIGGAKLEGTVVACAHHMLSRGLAKSRKELSKAGLPASFGAISIPAGDAAGIGSPASLNSYDASTANGFGFGGPSSLPGLSGASGALLLEKSFRAPREPRVTVWNPSNGRTISGNAAPCRRNLEAWMRQHPGWIPKEEGQLSSSRRSRNRKFRPSSVPSTAATVPSSVEPESPHFNDALQGLLFLSRSPTAYSPSDVDGDDSEMAEDDDNSTFQERTRVNIGTSKKNGMISSVSSSSAEDGNEVEGDEGEEDEVTAKVMEM